ncbi:SMI1/KNR4 family protein [Pyxidicoccus fallax]|uniref:SMI1/KNR4 family protein n=1 Tax=Pyxidicoccus fallax TaxID=394095 RepID=A0A848L4P1_9BACT|nr:SMI1/KNR4 family protein [Pyxidicoccus fallax]NMO13940.1 SMI1/KNR4 family protein [Pyxidicoccus fallax]NPC78339.1 SMI1/KNR4 family protein [Pyxidicoccus fallax]
MGHWNRGFELLRAQRIHVAPGLTAAELAQAEERFQFRFPPDLAEFLREGLPTGDGFPRWRTLDATLSRQFGWPLEGMLFDVECNGFWVDEWGERPEDLEAAKRIATEAVRAAPVLVPVYAHRYLPAEPLEAGNPVISVHQTDIICYGHDLASYFEAEWGVGYQAAVRHELCRPIRFWPVG